ncbi:MAG: hypothetical protein QXS02_02535 [Candidatus Thermoplasmatota archaeon]
MLTYGEGRYKIWLEKKHLGKDLLLILGGGEKPHIGGVVVCEPGGVTKVVGLEGHYDHQVLRSLAEAAYKKYKVTVVATGGIHIDNATKEEIDIIVKNCDELTKKFIYLS